jgi:survival-of-motor-neuron-related-splicing factor 30
MDNHEAQLAAVEAAISRDPGNEEWQRLRADLLEVIALKQQLTEVKGEAAASAAAAGQQAAAAAAAQQAAQQELRSWSIGEKCQALYEQDGNWYNAKVVALAEDGYFVTYLGYGNTAQVDFAELRPYVRPDTSEWRPGADVLAIAPADNRWYEAKIVNVRPANCTVRFAGETEPQEVELDAVRLQKVVAPPPPKAGGGGEGSSSGADAGKSNLPKQLEIKPDDSEETVARKKRKLNMYKRQEKKEAEEKAGDDRRNSWMNFQKKNKTVAKAKNWHDPNHDMSVNRSEAAAREKMNRNLGPTT